jgi:hypothetical protein
MRRGPFGFLILGLFCVCGVGCWKEPIPDHLGLFSVSGREIRELPVAPRFDEHNVRSSRTPAEDARSLENIGLDTFWALFSDASVLPSIPEHFVLYDPKFTPGDLHLFMLTSPRWQHGKLAVDANVLDLKIEPIEGAPAGMYRLHPLAPLSKGLYYILTGSGESATGNSGYMRPFCPQCDLPPERAAIAKARDEESARMREATTATKTLFHEQVRVAPYGADYYCTNCFWDLTVTDVDLTWTRNPSAGVSRARYADLRNVAWNPQWRCLMLPPLENSVCVLQTASSDEPKLQAFAKAGSAALAEWQKRYPRGLPYAEGPMGD